MAKIYIDTNVLLDFYQASHDKVEILDELISAAESIALPQQTAEEFLRNRVARLRDLAGKIENSTKVTMHTTAVVRSLTSFRDWMSARDAAVKSAKAMIVELNSWIERGSADPVFVAFREIYEKSGWLATTDKLIKCAHNRKLVGRPPNSPDKFTIGDELIWETLLELCKEDLVVVSRDRGFIDHALMLESEFGNNSRKLLLVTNSLGEGLKAIGKRSEKIAAAEKIMHSSPSLRTYTKHGDCPQCGAALEETGYEGADGDDAWWVVCPQCRYESFPR